MSRNWVLILWLALLWPSPSATAITAPSERAAETRQVLDVYVRDGCPHCAAAKQFLPQLRREHPHVVIAIHHVDRDSAARDQLISLSRNAGIWPPGVPTFAVNEQLVVGFDTPTTSAPALNQLLQQSLPPTPIDHRILGVISVERLGLGLFTLTLGLLDGFNPCAMWVLLFLLSLLIHVRNRLHMAAIAGTFVIVSGLIYFVFMAAWLNVFLAVGMSPQLYMALAAIAIVIGAVNISDVWRKAPAFTLAIPEASKRRLYPRMRAIVAAQSLPLALISVAVLAVLVNIVELLCTAGLPALYTAILTQQALTPLAHYAYLGLYILGYITDDALMVGLAVAALSSRKLTASTGRHLKLISGIVMLALGMIMLLKPQWLS